MFGWECPKCGRVWGPDTTGCRPCNTEVEMRRSGSPPTNFPTPPTSTEGGKQFYYTPEPR